MSIPFSNVTCGNLTDKDIARCKELSYLGTFQSDVAKNVLEQNWASRKQLAIIYGKTKYPSFDKGYNGSDTEDSDAYLITNYELCIGEFGD